VESIFFPPLSNSSWCSRVQQNGKAKHVRMRSVCNLHETFPVIVLQKKVLSCIRDVRIFSVSIRCTLVHSC